MARATERIRRLYDRIATSYDTFMRVYDALLVRGSREWICSRAAGRVLEIGVGTGLNLANYRSTARITGIDLSPRMLDRARERAARLGRDVSLTIGDAESLAFADESFDSVVMSFALSTIPDDARAIAEAARVLVRDGRLLVLDHGQSRNPAVRAVQRLAGIFTARLYEDQRTRDPTRHLATFGLIVEERQLVSRGWVLRLAARKPA